MSDWCRTLADLERCESPAILVTVTSVEGSAPRDPGAKMIVAERALYGTIGGGRLEQETTDVARALLATEGGALVRRVPLGPRLGQCCGGAVVLLLEPVRDAAWCAAVRALVRAQRACVAATVVATRGDGGVPVGAKLVVDGAATTGAWGAPVLEARVVAAARRLLADGGHVPTTLAALGHMILLEPIVTAPPVVVFGAGHVGRALVSILAGVPCLVTWIDSRADRYPAVVPENVTVELSDAPELEVDAAPPGAYFVVMTHSHQLDLAISERILRRGDFAYVGLIGSTAKRRRFERRLALRGIDADALGRMRCPIGIDGIRGKHPGEIAVAVAAELLQIRSRQLAAIAAPRTAPSAGSGAERCEPGRTTGTRHS